MIGPEQIHARANYWMLAEAEVRLSQPEKFGTISRSLQI